LSSLEAKQQIVRQAGTIREFDFEWNAYKYSGVPFEFAAPAILHEALDGILEKIHPETRIVFQNSDKPEDILDLEQEKGLSEIIQREMPELQTYILFNWVFDSSSKKLHFQSLFLSELPKRMLKVTDALQRTCYAIFLFIASIGLSMSAYFWWYLSVFAMVTYWLGWFMVTWVVILVCSLIPRIRRRQSLDLPQRE